MSAWLSAPAALYIVNCVGREKWTVHNHKLLKEAASLLHRAFDTEHVLGEPPTLRNTIKNKSTAAGGLLMNVSSGMC